MLLIDGNTQPMTDPELVQYALDQKIGLVGIGAMTRMIAKAYRVADALRAAGIPVVMGGPHVTECPDEALGRDGGPPPRRRHRARRSRRDLATHRRRRRPRTAQGSLHAGRRLRPGTETDSPGLSRRFPGTRSISISSTASRVSSAASCTTTATPGRRSTSSRSRPAAAALTAASSAPSPGSSAIPSASAPTRASSTRCCG